MLHRFPTLLVCAFAAISMTMLLCGCVSAPVAEGCEGVEVPTTNPALDHLIAQTDGWKIRYWEYILPEKFRSLQYLQLAVALQALPRPQAEAQLRVWACSGKHGLEVICLCRLLFVSHDGQPLAKPPDSSKFTSKHPLTDKWSYYHFDHLWSMGQSDGTSWPSWPLTLVRGIPFCISSNPSGGSMVVDDDGPVFPEHPPSSFAPVYLEYCLKEGQWTTYQYKVVDLEARRQALDSLIHSPAWPHGLNKLETDILTKQIGEN